MRTILHIVLGAVAGFALGILGPIALAFPFALIDPQFRQGGATPFAILIIVTAPLGAIAGAIWGFCRANPVGGLVKFGPRGSLARFESRYGGLSHEDQRETLAEVLPGWLSQYRVTLVRRLVLYGALFFFFGSMLLHAPLILALFLGLAARTVIFVYHMREVLNTISQRWGAEIVDRCAPLPITLRIGRAAAGGTAVKS